jgi:uncharacterized protein
MAAKPRMTFLNLPVADPAASRRFFEALGFTFDDRFSDESTASMVVNEGSIVMFLSRDKFAGFAKRPLPDPAATTGAMLALSADTREDVDAFADTALREGGTTAAAPLDYGFMYGRSFYDPDGHHWEVVWMDQQAVEQGPPDMAEQPA